MQYPVPQFTDVEDKIIGPLSLKQFGIVGGAGGIIFFFFSATKSIPFTVVLVLLLGLPAIFLAFGKLNGRPLYSNISSIIQFLFNPKIMVFRKQGFDLSSNSRVEKLTVENAQTTVPTPEEATSRLKQLNYALQQQAQAERELLEQPKRLR